MTATQQTNSRDNLERIAAWLVEKKAENIMALDVQGYSQVTEGLILATAKSVRQAKALGSWLLEQGKKHGAPAMGAEGMDTGQWILVDFNDVVVHIFLEEARELYNIEDLFADVPRIPLGDQEKDHV